MVDLALNCIRGMASFVDSAATFSSRATAVGVEPATLTALTTAGVDTLAKLAFACNYTPNAADDTPFNEFLTAANTGTALSLGQVACVRRLFFEAHTLVVADLKSQVEKTDESAPRKVPAPERVARYNRQQTRLVGLQLTGELEPAHSLLDAVLQQCDNQVLKYLPPNKCPKREQEVAATKADQSIVLDASSKKLTVARAEEDVPSDTSSELKIMWALQRRGLAYDQADVIRWETHEAWIREMFSHLYRAPPPGYARVSVAQILRADRELFTKVAEVCREGITPRADGSLPVDGNITVFMHNPCVQFHFLPLPAGTSRPVQEGGKRQMADTKFQETEQSKQKYVKTKGGGKGKRTSRVPTMPEQLKGMYYKTRTGERICFAYNLPGGCAGAEPGKDCSRGKHVCCQPKCQKAHSLSEHS